MTQPPAQDPRVFNRPKPPIDWPEPNSDLKKIVIGPSPGTGDAKPVTLEALPADFAKRYPELTHLYLWGVRGLKELPPLPPKLVCLDLRGSTDLAVLRGLPEGLKELILDGCAGLQEAIRLEPGSLPCLEVASLNGCGKLPEAWIWGLLKAAPRLREFHGSECPQLKGIPGWPGGLERIELNGCKALRGLPERWPGRLRRLGLADADQVTRLPALPERIDYLDVSGTRGLHELPANWDRVRTLYLHGSGVLMPPASEHGKSKSENVAARTKAYFEDVRLVGQGEVKRCKVLFLGNGHAGKTSLALALTPGEDPARAKELGSTHGVQFWDWDLRTDVGGVEEPVHLHLWDFGGQEIYHNTHRLFMSTGAVFVVLWDPDQDGRQPKKNPTGYQDQWRPLRYWIDFIELACPHRPRIAVVCSRHTEVTAELRTRFARAMAGKDYPLFAIDSLPGAGDLSGLAKWLELEVGQVVHQQGVAVPTYWEIAQDMVEGWVRRMRSDPGFAAVHHQLPKDQFREELEASLRSALERDTEGRYDLLREALNDGSFELDDDRLRRTLGFLTHSGWIFWDERLFEGRVIVGQKWALDGIYVVLERTRNKKESPVFQALAGNRGRFTLSQLGELSWNGKGYSFEEQALLLSFMLTCGLCFRLRRGEDAWLGEDVYVSFEHLPEDTAPLERAFLNRLRDLNLEKKLIAAPQLHRLHWQAILTRAGAAYGASAAYSARGFHLENAEGQKLLILYKPDEIGEASVGLGGRIEVHVAGPSAAERLKEAEAFVAGCLPGGDAGETTDAGKALGASREVVEVFISYAWGPPQREGETGIPKGYEEPVDAIERYLEDKPVRLIRDRKVVGFGDDLKAFMTSAAKSPHVIVVHSDRYWRSPYCIFELWLVGRALEKNQDRSLLSVVIPVEHLNSNIRTDKGAEAHKKFWSEFEGTPCSLGWSDADTWAHAHSLINEYSTDLSAHHNFNLRWDRGAEYVLEQIRQRLGLPGKEGDG